VNHEKKMGSYTVGCGIFFQKALAWDHVQTTRIITVDKNPSYPAAIKILKKNKELPQEI
jgi:IS6 family transposase